MPKVAPNPLAGFAATIERALDLGEPGAIAAAVREALATQIAAGTIELPASATEAYPERYARRLVHRDPAGRFSIVAMAWGPGQVTSLHDHGGVWCVEGVVRGSAFAIPHRATEISGDRYRFEVRKREVQQVGETSALFPPFEHHIYGNASAEVPALTLHVYGPELLKCACYALEDDGAWVRRERALSYDPW